MNAWLINRVSHLYLLYTENNRLLDVNRTARALSVKSEHVIWAIQQIGIKRYYHCPYTEPLDFSKIRYKEIEP